MPFSHRDAGTFLAIQETLREKINELIAAHATLAENVNNRGNDLDTAFGLSMAELQTMFDGLNTTAVNLQGTVNLNTANLAGITSEQEEAVSDYAAGVAAFNTRADALQAGLNTSYASRKHGITTTDTSRVGCVSLVDDDGYGDVITRLMPILAARGMKGALSIITGSIGAPSYMTAANVNTAVAAGWELLGHGHDYVSNLTEFPIDANLDYQLGAGCQDILGTYAPTYGFTFPQHQSDTRIRRMTRKYYDFAFGKIGINDYPLDTMLLKRIAIGSWTEENPTVNGNAEKNTLAYYKACVDYAKANGSWLVLMTHIGQQDAAGDLLLGQVLDYIVAQNVPFVTPSEAYSAHGNRLFMGDTAGDWLAVSEQGIAGSGIQAQWKLPINSKTVAAGLSTFRVGITHMNVNGVWALAEGLPNAAAGVLITHNAGEVATNYAYGRQEYRTASGKVFTRAALSDTAWGAWYLIATTRWDATAGRVAYVWDNLSVREQLVYGDTGWRTLTPENGWTATRVVIRRVGYQVFLRHAGLLGSAATATTFATLPVGFAPTSNVMLSARNSAAGFLDIMARSNNTVTADLLAAFSTSEQHGMWITDAAWPATLPGTAAVPIPYN